MSKIYPLNIRLFVIVVKHVGQTTGSRFLDAYVHVRCWFYGEETKSQYSPINVTQSANHGVNKR